MYPTSPAVVETAASDVLKSAWFVRLLDLHLNETFGKYNFIRQQLSFFTQ